MRATDLLRESVDALRGSRSRTLLTAAGVTVGALALVLILSLSLGLSTVVDDLVSGEQQLRQVVITPGFGGRIRGGEVPQVDGEMSEEKRARLRRALSKRSRGGPSMLTRTYQIDAETEAELAALPGIETARPFLQERFDVTLPVAASDEAQAEAENQHDAEDQAAGARSALAIGMPAEHPYYPLRVLAGRWFHANDERGVVVHELLLYHLGYTSDEAQAGLVGTTISLTSRKGGGGGSFVELVMGGGAGGAAGTGEIRYVEELPIVGVLKERFGLEPASVVEEAWSMQTDVFLPQALARELWDRKERSTGPRALLLVAKTLDDVGPIEDAARERGLQARSVREVVQRVKQSLTAATWVAGFLAGIAVFVSCLGIVNTMVMSVLERTREIGLLKALGARNRDVLLLFLTEGALIGLGGGLLGVGLARALGVLGNKIGRSQLDATFQMPVTVDLFQFPGWLLLGGIGFAVGVSLIASVIPALRAARVDPVTALRHE